MSIIVQKFGGSSLSSAEKILHAAHIIKNAHDAGDAVIAVLSAQGDMTDHLLAKACELSAAPDGRETDALLSAGEQISTALCAIALHALGVPAVSLCAWQIPIETDGVHRSARITEIGRTRIDRELEAGKVVLVAGFQGIDASGDVVTLGRGGSDTTAAAIAVAFGAKACRIYTDVDGVYTTDPSLCPQAKRLGRVPYDHMLLLASKGAQVLHERSVETAARGGIPLEVLSCNGGDGTRVEECTADVPITGITRSRQSDGKLDCVSVVGESLPSTRALHRGVTAVEREGVTVCGVEEGERFFSLFVPKESAVTALRALHHAFFESET